MAYTTLAGEAPKPINLILVAIVLMAESIVSCTNPFYKDLKLSEKGLQNCTGNETYPCTFINTTLVFERTNIVFISITLLLLILSLGLEKRMQRNWKLWKIFDSSCLLCAIVILAVGATLQIYGSIKLEQAIGQDHELSSMERRQLKSLKMKYFQIVIKEWIGGLEFVTCLSICATIVYVLKKSQKRLNSENTEIQNDDEDPSENYSDDSSDETLESLNVEAKKTATERIGDE